jgi:hypothetical protein
MGAIQSLGVRNSIWLLYVYEFLCNARRRSAADTFRSDPIEQASLHIVGGVEIA